MLKQLFSKKTKKLSLSTEERSYLFNLEQLSSPENSLAYFTDTVGFLLEQDLFKEVDFEKTTINIHISPLLYLQLRNYWGGEFFHLLEEDPIYSSIHLDTTLNIQKPVFIYLNKKRKK